MATGNVEVEATGTLSQDDISKLYVAIFVTNHPYQKPHNKVLQ